MKKVTINIPDNKFTFFMKLMRSLNFVKVVETPDTLSQLTAEQKDTWENIKQGFVELKLADEGEIEFRSVQELLNELTEDEEDAYLLNAMEETKNEPIATEEEAGEFIKWLKTSVSEFKKSC